MTELVSPGYRPVFPKPAKEYNLSDQDNFRTTIQRALDYKLNRNEAAVFGGIPNSFIKGSNATFSVPTGSTFTKLTGGSVVESTDLATVIDAANATFTPSLTTDWDVIVKLKYASGGLGVVGKMGFALFAGGVQFDGYRMMVQLDSAHNIQARFSVLAVPKSSVCDVRIIHPEAGSVVFDLTNSFWGVRRTSSMVGLQT